MEALFQYYKKILTLLRAKEFVGGLEISDDALRFAVYDGIEWKFASVRLAPHVMVLGEIKDKEQFARALMELRTELVGTSRRKVMIVLSLGSVEIYTVTFSLPRVDSENLDKAIQLNIQMASPTKFEDLYAGWQTIEADGSSLRLEILAAFVKRSIVDPLIAAFDSAGFIVAAIEPKALALSRLAVTEGAGFEKSVPAIIFEIDEEGLSFVIVRNGQFYFQYSNFWRDIQDEKGAVSMQDFTRAIIRSVHQVLNFYAQHWSEPMRDMYIVSPSMRDDVALIVKNNFGFAPRFLEMQQFASLDPRWYPAVGSGIRGSIPRRSDKDLSLLGFEAHGIYARARLANFLGFWRVVFPVALGLLLLILAGGDLFLASIRGSLEARLALQPLSGQELQDISSLSSNIQAFNATVALMKNAEASVSPKGPALEKLLGFFTDHGIAPNHFTISQVGDVALSGSAANEDQILAFKKALESDGDFSKVDLPIGSIVSGSNGVAFAMSFTIALPHL